MGNCEPLKDLVIASAQHMLASYTTRLRRNWKQHTGILNSSARYFKIAASLASRFVRSIMLLDPRLSNSFLTRDAMESTTISFTFLVMRSSSKFCNLLDQSNEVMWGCFLCSAMILQQCPRVRSNFATHLCNKAAQVDSVQTRTRPDISRSAVSEP